MTTVESFELMVARSVRQLHSKRTATNDYMAPYTYEFCVECRQAWPCATEQAIQGTLDVLAPEWQDANRSDTHKSSESDS